MVVVNGSIDWDMQTEGGNTKPRSLENFGMITGIKIESDADSEGEVVSAADDIPVGVFVPAGTIAAAVVSAQSETEFALMGLSTETHKHAVKILVKQIKCHQMNQLAYEEKIRVLSYKLEEKSSILEYRQKLIDQAKQEKQKLMTKLDNEIANQVKWNNSGKNLYKLIYSSMSSRTKRGLGLDKYIGEGELGIDDSKLSIFHTNSNELEGQPIYNRFASVDHIKAVPPPLTGNYMPPSNIPDIDESQMMYGKKATDSSKIKSNDDSISHSNDSVHFDFNDRSSEPSTHDLQTCDSNVECSRPNHNDRDSTNYISSVSVPAKSHFRKDKSVASKSGYVCGSYLHLIKDYDFHEQTFAKRNAEGNGILGRRPTGKPVNPNRQNPVSAGQPNPVSAGQQNTVSAGQPNPVSVRQQNTVFAGPPNLVFAGWPWIKYGMSKTKGSKINGGLKSKSWSYAKGNKDKLEDFEDFDGKEVTFGGSTGKISRKGTIKTKNLNFENVLYVEELQHFNIIAYSQICDQAHRVLFTENECLVLFKDFPLPDPSMVLVTKPYHKTHYELLTGDKPSISYLKHFGCHVTILNTSDPLGKFDKMSDEGYIVGYSISSKTYKVYNLVSRKIDETMNLNFLKNKPFEDDLDSDDKPDVLNIKSTPTSVVPIVNEATTQNDGTKFDLTQINADNLDELAELQALQRQEQAGKEEADLLGLAFPSLNPILGVGTASIGSFVSVGGTPPVFAGSTPQMSPCASPIFANRHSSAAGKSHVSAGRPTGSAVRHVSAGKPTGSVGRPVSTGRPTSSAGRLVSAGRLSIPTDRSSVPAGRILGKCKKQTIVATSFCEDEYVAAASCCGQSTWSMRLFERGFCCLRPILLVRMVSTGGHSFLLVAVVSIHFCWSCDFLLVVRHSCW
nr:retrovirus-related Pol polyprotein from transposon TNT 1-94 [Tanacetum cinerariifolium]